MFRLRDVGVEMRSEGCFIWGLTPAFVGGGDVGVLYPKTELPRCGVLIIDVLGTFFVVIVVDVGHNRCHGFVKF